MKNFNFLSKLCGSLVGSQSNDVGFDCRLTVGSPSFDCRSAMLKLVSVLVLILTVGVGQIWGANAPVNTVLWSENFAHFGTSKPSTAGTNTGTGGGTKIYDGASISYSESSTSTKAYSEKLAGGTSPELLLAKGNTTWTISGIKTGNASVMTLTFKSNYASYASVSTSESTKLAVAESSAGTWTISVKDGQTAPATFNLTITNTQGNGKKDKNIRLDDVELKVTTAGGGGGCSNQVNITNSSPTNTTNGSFTLDKTGSQDACSALSVVVTPNPDPHYHVATVSATDPASTGTAGDAVDNRDGTYTITYSANAKGNSTISVTFAEDTHYTVTWMKNGSQHTTTEVYSGEKPTFPSNPSSCDATSDTFYGWSTTAWTGALDDVSTKTIYTDASAMPAVTGAVTYYAVFAKAVKSDNFQLLTDANNFISGGDYLIESYFSDEDHVLKAANYNSKTYQQTSENSWTLPSGGVNFDMSGKSALCIWKITSEGNNRFSIYNASANKYLVLVTVSTYDNLILSATKDASFIRTIVEEEGYSDAFRFESSAVSGKHLYCEGDYWDAYTSAEKVYLYKRVTTYSKYRTNCCTNLGSINGSVKVISGTSVTLQWDVLSGVDGTTPYSVSVSPSEGTSVGEISTVDGRKNCTISGLTAGTEYTFTINAFGDGSHCDKSQDIVATTPKITLGSASGTSTYIEGSGPGSKQTFTVDAVGLTGNLTVTAPTNFAVCATESGSYTSSITLTPTSGAVSTTVYFQLEAGKTAASSPYAGNVTVSGGSATSQTVAVNGTVSQACHTPTISGQPAASASYNMNVTATALSVTADKGDVSDPTLTYQWYSNTANSKTTPEPSPIDGATSSSYTPPTTATGTKYYFCEVSSGACSLTSSISAITVNTPSLTVSETARAFGDREVNAGPYTMTFTVSGSNLAKDAPITISGASGMFSVDKTSVSQTSTGAVSTTTITVTYNPTTTATHNATLTIASTGATSKTVTLSGTGKNAATVKIEIAGSESTISGTRYEGDSYTLPSTAADCPDMGFYGWYKGTYSHATTAPTGANFYLPGATATLTAGENKFYAVYATITPDAANTYTKITSTGELVTGDYLLVAYFSSSYIEAMKNTVNASNYMDEVNVKNYVNNTTTPTKVTLESDNSAIRWRITKSSSTITIYNAAVSKYFCGSTGTPALNTTSENFSYSVTSGNWTLVTNSKTVYYSNQWYVGTPSSAKEIYLFKRDPSIAGPYTTSPSCVTHDLTVVASPVAGGTAMAVKTTLGESKTTTATATPDDHYTFSHWTISGYGSSMSNTSDGKSTDNPVTVTMGTEDATLTAHFTEKEKCTVVFKNNGETESSTTYWLGEHPIAPTLTDGVSNDACDATSDKHFGWTQTAWSNTLEQAAIDAKTAADVKVYAKDATLPAITAGDDGTTITYHAVWAKGSGGTTTISIDGDGLQAVVSSISSGYHSKDFTVGGYTFNGSQVTKCTDSGTAHDWFQLKKNNDKITIPTLPGRITNISSTAIRTATSGNVNTGVYFNSSATTSDAIASETLSSATSFSLDVTGNHTSGYLLFGAATCINQLSVTYSTVSYSKYLTTCCDKNVTLATNSPSHGSITFLPSGTISTCGADVATRQTTMTVTPDVGYYLSTWSTSGVTPASLSTDIAYGSVSNSGAQATTVTFNQNTTAGTYTANATFAAIPVSSLTLHATKKDNTSATIFDETGNNVALSLYPTEGKTASPADPLGHTVKIEFGAVLPANALNKGYTWSATVNGVAVGWSSNDLATNAVLEFNKSSGKVVAKAAGTAEIIITADDGSGITAKVTITVANVALSTLNVAKSSTTLYVGEAEEIAVTYDPMNTTTKGYTTGSYTYVTVGRSNDKITLTGKAVTPGEPERVTLTSSDAGAKTATIDVTVKPLPKVTFVDNLQGKTDFSNWGSDGVVSSTVTDGVVTHTKPTPSHTDISDPGASYNACERSHLHLVGWIESTWADAHPSATHEQIVGANVSNGAGTFLEAGADFNVETYNGNTYYAVWSQVE